MQLNKIIHYKISIVADITSIKFYFSFLLSSTFFLNFYKFFIFIDPDI